MAERQIGITGITFTWLEQQLGLDDKHRIVSIVPQSPEDVMNQSLRFVVEGPTLPYYREGSTLPIVFGSKTEGGDLTFAGYFRNPDRG